jgi:hypothetical protein
VFEFDRDGVACKSGFVPSWNSMIRSHLALDPERRNITVGIDL